MIMPYLGDFRITKLYGTKPPAGMSYSAGKHPGVDLVGVDSKQIRAVAAGTVYRVGYDEKGWGKYIVVKQIDGLYAIYCHLSKQYKSTGQTIKAGEVIGVEGATGMVTGKHLHFELRKVYSDKYSTVNPAKYLGISEKIGTAKGVAILKKNIKIILNGKEKTVKAIESDGFYYVKLQDLRDSKIEIAYTNGKPAISSK